MAFDVFISYPHQDKAVADAACAKLEAEGIRCWIAPRDIPPSAEWAASIVEAINNCRVMVVVFSSHSNQSKQVHREVQRAFDSEKPVIPFRIEDVMPEGALAYYMPSVHWLDALTPPVEEHLEELAAKVKPLLQVPADVGAASRVIPLKRSYAGFSSAKWALGAGLALAILLAAALVLWKHSVVFVPPSPPTLEQSILLNILHASYDEPLSRDIPRTGMTVQQLMNEIRDGYPRELLFWLFDSTFELTTADGDFEYNYAPPNNLGCDSLDPRHRCYVDWIRASVLSGVTVEEKQIVVAGQTTFYHRFCFDQTLGRQAMSDVPDSVIAQIKEDIGPPERLYAGPLVCGSTLWHPEKVVGSPSVFTFMFDNGNKFQVSPRSVSGVFSFLGALLKLERTHFVASPERYPPDRPWVADLPTLLTAPDDPPLITVVKQSNGNCFVRVHFKNNDYCVPETASTTKRVFSILGQLVPNQLTP